jgi:hypothetical protein
VLSVLCKVFKTRGLMLFYASDKNTRRLAGLLACVVSIIWGVSRVWWRREFSGNSYISYIEYVSYFEGSQR